VVPRPVPHQPKAGGEMAWEQVRIKRGNKEKQ